MDSRLRGNNRIEVIPRSLEIAGNEKNEILNQVQNDGLLKERFLPAVEMTKTLDELCVEMDSRYRLDTKEGGF